MDTIFLARYRTQHLLTVTSEYGNPVGAGWYDEGSEAAFSVSSPTGLLPRRVFTGWSGDADASSASSLIKMDGPKAVEASWRTDYTVAVGTLAAVVLAIAALMVLGKRAGGYLLRARLSYDVH